MYQRIPGILHGFTFWSVFKVWLKFLESQTDLAEWWSCFLVFHPHPNPTTVAVGVSCMFLKSVSSEKCIVVHQLTSTATLERRSPEIEILINFLNKSFSSISQALQWHSIYCCFQYFPYQFKIHSVSHIVFKIVSSDQYVHPVVITWLSF